MPRIDNKTIDIKRPFKKKPYRPWNLLEDDVLSPTVKEYTENTPSKLVTIKEPLSNQNYINKESNCNQIDTNQETQVTYKEPLSNPISNQNSNQFTSQEVQKNDPIIIEKNTVDVIQRVSGLQRKILFHIVESCILSDDLKSSPITIESLKMLTNADIDTIKTATQRLINKHLIQRGAGKKGRGGFAIFYVTEQIRNAVMNAQKKEITHTHLVTNKEPLSIYSSSSIINTTTTNAKELNFFQNGEATWDHVNIEPLTHIGFTKSHLRQIILNDKLSVTMVQDSIDAFAFDLKINNKEKSLKSSALNYFMGILRAGNPYAPPVNYESPHDIALRLYLERKKEMEQKRQAMEDELFQISFKEWESALNQDEKDKIFPKYVKNSRVVSEKIACLRLHFKDQIWPSLKRNLVNKK